MSLRALTKAKKRARPRLVLRKKQPYKRRWIPHAKPHKSEQAVGTPWELIEAISKRFGKVTWDLAATEKNAKAKRFITPEDDTFTVDWTKLRGTLFLNPPFGQISKFAAYCKEMFEKAYQQPISIWRIVMLVPASVGAKWWEDSVFNSGADVYFLRSRIQFVNAIGTYPKDCALVVYDVGSDGSTNLWDWKTDRLVTQE